MLERDDTDDRQQQAVNSKGRSHTYDEIYEPETARYGGVAEATHDP